MWLFCVPWRVNYCQTPAALTECIHGSEPKQSTLCHYRCRISSFLRNCQPVTAEAREIRHLNWKRRRCPMAHQFGVGYKQTGRAAREQERVSEPGWALKDAGMLEIDLACRQGNHAERKRESAWCLPLWLMDHMHCLLWTSHILTVSSLEPDSRRVPSIDTDRHVTRFLSRRRETVIVEFFIFVKWMSLLTLVLYILYKDNIV